jgi:hypothetical protein
MAELRAFIAATFSHWESVVLGGIATILLWSYPQLVQALGYVQVKDAPAWLTYSGIVLGALIACYRSWSDQRSMLAEAQRKLESLTKPKLEIRFLQMTFGPAPDHIFIAIETEVRNTGAPSICDGYQLVIVTPDGSTYHPSAVFVPGQTRLEYINAAAKTFEASEHLAKKTSSDPIQTGAKRTGILTYTISGLSMQQLCDPKTAFEIRSLDVYGNPVVGRYVGGNTTATPSAFPGINYKDLSGGTKS